jgi:8-oxo-dGTP pyrophosphatase MutT (NUDIX family)
VGALALVVRPAGEVLLLHHRFRVGGAWGLPGGWLEAHEDPQGAIVRELAEELGLRVERSEVALLHIESRASRNHLEVFFRVPVADSFAVPPNFEFTDWRWFRAGELPTDMLPLHRGLVERWLES